MSASGTYQPVTVNQFSKKTLKFCSREQPWVPSEGERFRLSFMMLTIVQANGEPSA
jgi:hypothetical protein